MSIVLPEFCLYHWSLVCLVSIPIILQLINLPLIRVVPSHFCSTFGAIAPGFAHAMTETLLFIYLLVFPLLSWYLMCPVQIISLLSWTLYGNDILHLLRKPLKGSPGYTSFKSKEKRHADKFLNLDIHKAEIYNIIDSWPTPAPEDVVFQCLNDYVKGTEWSLPPPCAICSRWCASDAYVVWNHNKHHY